MNSRKWWMVVAVVGCVASFALLQVAGSPPAYLARGRATMLMAITAGLALGGLLMWVLRREERLEQKTSTRRPAVSPKKLSKARALYRSEQVLGQKPPG